MTFIHLVIRLRSPRQAIKNDSLKSLLHMVYIRIALNVHFNPTWAFCASLAKQGCLYCAVFYIVVCLG